MELKESRRHQQSALHLKDEAKVEGLKAPQIKQMSSVRRLRMFMSKTKNKLCVKLQTIKLNQEK